MVLILFSLLPIPYSYKLGLAGLIYMLLLPVYCWAS